MLWVLKETVLLSTHNICADLFSMCLKTMWNLNFEVLIFCRHTASLKILSGVLAAFFSTKSFAKIVW